jgi:peptide subunit release factor 1 (eRF1)
MPVALSEERHRDQALVAAILEGASARSGAVVGPVATLEALARGRVDVVVANGNLRGTVLRCTSCGHVTARETSTCPLCGSPVEGMSLPQALPALARHRGAALRIIRASVGNGLEPHQGLGALLRYAPGRATMEPGTG